jgi:hydrogenase/urease accessory protein HupE
MIARLALVLLVLVAAASDAAAHSVNFAVAFITVEAPTPAGTPVKVTLTITGTDIDRAAATHIADPASGMVRPGWLRDAEPILARYIQERTQVTAGDAACPLAGPMTIAADSDTGVNVEMRFTCPPGNAAIVYRSTAMVDFDPAARQAVMLWDAGDYTQVALLDRDTTTTMLQSRTWLGVPIDVVGEYVMLGIEHIFLGYDHIAFLIAVLLWARRLMTLVKVVTAFTIAHSITLSLAALDIVQIPSSIVEPAIAATIVLVAVENFISRNVENRWMWTGPLGLIHGFGFASALAERGLPHSALVYSLAAFNIGVEIGQIAIVSLVLPLMWLADRAMAKGATPVRQPALVYSFSVLVAALGLWWFAERTVLG